ncbi:MAG TPA: N-acetylmuramoyl-L-alanine amidase [Actinoplanes sp.]
MRVGTSTRVIAGLAATVTGAAMVAAGPVAQARPAVPDRIGAGPQLQTIELSSAPGTARTEAATGALGVAPRATRPFSLVGATWTDPHAPLDGAVEVRTRSTADRRWSAWRALDSDGPDAAETDSADRPARGSTDPLWAGPSDGVEARLASADGRTHPVPAGLRLDLINPDEDAAAIRTDGVERPTAGEAPVTADERSPEPTQAAEPRGADRPEVGEAATTQRAAAATMVLPRRPVPRLVTRAGWRANEAIVKHAPEYTGAVQVVFVHHTATGNNYACGQSASIIRGIELYHVRSKGWNDIGYNFLVDKCGTLFEGRAGGVDKPVLGAHTLGFNSNAAAIAVIGDYTGRGAPARVRSVIAQVAAYKLGAYGNNPAGRVVLTSNGSDRYRAGTRVALNRISGHRDTGRTACPGTALYGQLGGIRALASAGPAGLGFLRMTGATRFGNSYFTRGAVSPLWTLRTASGMLYRFDVIVDGTLVASTPNTHRTAPLHLAAGWHTVTVRAVHLSGRTAIVTARIFSDATAPVFGSAPEVALRRGSLKAAVPMRLSWAVTDNGGLRSVALTRPAATQLGTAPRTWPGFAAAGTATTWTVRAIDRAGNATGASVTRTPMVIAEAAALRTGSWRSLTNPAYLGGRAMISVAAGGAMTYSITGRGAQLAVSQTRGSGRLRVYVDGRYAGIVDLRSAATVHRMAVWAVNWPSAGSHTLRFVLEGTRGRPGVIMDGLVVLR